MQHGKKDNFESEACNLEPAGPVLFGIALYRSFVHEQRWRQRLKDLYNLPKTTDKTCARSNNSPGRDDKTQLKVKRHQIVQDWVCSGGNAATLGPNLRERIGT